MHDTGLSRRDLLASGAAIAGAAAVMPGRALGAGGLDVVIAGGRVVDGTGRSAFRADVGIRRGRIAAIGDLSRAHADRIDARGRLVAPGFIDLHSHADEQFGPGLRDDDPRRRAAPNLVTQGITTVVVNPDGRSAWPIDEQRATMRAKAIGPNAILMVGHNTVRGLVLGDDHERPSTRAETQRMRELVHAGMRAGAWGLSAGLEYEPGRWSEPGEVVELMRTAARFGGFYIAHQRSEGRDPLWYVPSQDQPDPPTVIDAIEETIEIGARTGARVVASHIKSKAPWWGRSAEIVGLIERARARGVDVWADLYSYDTTGTDGNTVLIPDWALAGTGDFPARLRATLADPAKAAAVRGDIAHEIERRGGPERIVVFDYPDPAAIGRNLGQLAAARGVALVEMAILLQLEGYPTRRGGGRLRGFSLSEADIEVFAARPWVATSTDGGVALPEDGPTTHPRYYGSFTRKLRRYAIERGVLSLEAAIRAGTGLPAAILRLRDRGLLKRGYVADVVVLDPERVRDKATFEQPHQYSEGIERVLVNGTPVVADEQPTWALPGRVLTPRRDRRP